MPNEREARTRVKPYRRANGTRVAGHPTHYETGTPEWQVYFRKKELHGKVGPRPKRRWQLYDTYRSYGVANRAAHMLMRGGQHAITVKVGAREEPPNQRELEARLARADADRSRRRRR
jgi:hypothetical protein